MLATLGLLVTLAFAVAFNSLIFFPVLFWVFAFGLLWDALFIALQSLRWDRDWGPGKLLNDPCRDCLTRQSPATGGNPMLLISRKGPFPSACLGTVSDKIVG